MVPVPRLPSVLCLRRLVVVPLLVLVLLFGVECATPTALTVTVYSEVACGKGSLAALVGGGGNRSSNRES